MSVHTSDREQVTMVQIDQIHVLNPRTRNKRIHRELIDNIQAIGLKRPITVSRRISGDGPLPFDLVCGQGRLEAFQFLNQTAIPAFIIDATEEDCLVMSLVENVARRQHRPIELMAEVGRLRERGDSDSQIAERIGVTASWINMIGGLLERGEQKLLVAVETGLIPLSMATDIARSSEAEIQNLLADAYEQGFKGKRLTKLRHLLELRSKKDKLDLGTPLGRSTVKKRKTTSADLLRLFERDAERQRLIVKKASITADRLTFITHAMKDLLAMSSFSQLLIVEKIDSIPKFLHMRIHSIKRSA